MLAERLMVGSEVGRFEERLNGLRLIDGGHVEDDESDLIYMRARYYEPTSGRFLSKDPQMQGANWLVYCRDNPINYHDKSGRDFDWLAAIGVMAWSAGFVLSFVAFAVIFLGKSPASLTSGLRLASLAFLLITESDVAVEHKGGWSALGALGVSGAKFAQIILMTAMNSKLATKAAGGFAAAGVLACSFYTIMVLNYCEYDLSH